MRLPCRMHQSHPALTGFLSCMGSHMAHGVYVLRLYTVEETGLYTNWCSNGGSHRATAAPIGSLDPDRQELAPPHRPCLPVCNPRPGFHESLQSLRHFPSNITGRVAGWMDALYLPPTYRALTYLLLLRRIQVVIGGTCYFAFTFTPRACGSGIYLSTLQVRTYGMFILIMDVGVGPTTPSAPQGSERSGDLNAGLAHR